MEKLYIPQIAKSVAATEAFEFKEFIEGLETLTPVQGVISVKHVGSFLEVSSKASTIMTLTCDRTLVQFNYRLAIDNSEMIWLEEVRGGQPPQSRCAGMLGCPDAPAIAMRFEMRRRCTVRIGPADNAVDDVDASWWLCFPHGCA